ncbi:MAG: hypothetical protein AAGF27_12530 [Pseudomonadota bacterium]
MPGRACAYRVLGRKALCLALDRFAGVFKIWRIDVDDRIGGTNLNRSWAFSYDLSKDVRDNRGLTDAAETRACFTRYSPNVVTA